MDLVKKLSIKQPIEFESRTDTLEELKERLLEMKFVFVTFTQTKGGTQQFEIWVNFLKLAKKISVC